MAIVYPELDEVIKLFKDLRFMRNGRCARCSGAAGENHRHISRHHVFPNRHWPENEYVVHLCMANGKQIDDVERNVIGSGCHPLIERWIKRIEEGKKQEPMIYCLLTMAFLRGESFFNKSMPKI